MHKRKSLSIGTLKAESIPGVELVMTYLNFPKAFRKDIHYAGEHVAAVVAVDEETAEEALRLINVQSTHLSLRCSVWRRRLRRGPLRFFPARTTATIGN